MTPEDSMKLANTLAETARAEADARPAPVETAKSHSAPGPEVIDLATPTFLHEREVGDALRIITLLASGRNPFGEETFERLRPGQSTEILRALSVVVCTLVGTPKPMRVSPTDSPAVPSDSASKRPLDQYLERLEKEAIREALAETGNNQTAAARLLGLTYRALRHRIESLKIEVP